MPATARREREKLQRYQEIVDAGERVFFTHGFAATSMDEIAREAQLSRSLLYVYFKDKSAIMRAVMLNALQSMEDRFRIALQSETTGLAQIEKIGRAYYQFSVDETDYFDVLTEMNTFPDPDEPDDISRGMIACRKHIDAMMVEALSNGIEDTSLDAERVGNPLMTAYILQGALHGVIMSTRKPKRPDMKIADSKKMVMQLIRMMCYAMQS